MSSQDREFQLEILRIQLKHRRYVGFCCAFGALGGSFVVFTLTIIANAMLTETKIPDIWEVMLRAYFLVGGIFLAISIASFFSIAHYERNRIEELRNR